MKMKRTLCMVISCIFLFCCAAPFGASATAHTPTRIVHVVYDDSGSMYLGVDTWCRAKYSMEVFSAMLGEADRMNVYYMSDYCAGSSAPPRVSLNGADGPDVNVAKIHNQKTTANSTPFNAVKKAYADLNDATADEKWLVILTDGEFEDGRMTTSEIDRFLADKSQDIMYERMALQELEGDEEQLQSVAEAMFGYAFDDNLDIRSMTNRGRQWSLVHKHHSYMEYLIAYHFYNCIVNAQTDSSALFFRTILTSGESVFFVQMLRENYSLQNALYRFVTERYDSFDTYQKSNGIYWIGRLTYSNLLGSVLGFLRKRFDELRPIVKGVESFTQDNLDRHFLFRSICTGLLFQGQADAMDEFLCMIITNDAANALNRGATIEYYGDSYQVAANNTYYLDTDLTAGSHAIRALCQRIEDSLNKHNGKFSENNLVTLATILQVRIQSKSARVMPELETYVQKVIRYLELYQIRPQHTSSNKIEFYLSSVLDDFKLFLSRPDFNISQCVYDKYKGIKDIKRQQWTRHEIYDPESVSEHLYSAWLMAMLFLPEDLGEAGYNKREILDMLLIHDLAEAEIGDQILSLNEPTRDLKGQNVVLRKLFVKGTYPQIANLTYYYNIWTGYYNGMNINARIARDINTIQTSYTFFEYYLQYPDHFSENELLVWNRNQEKLNTEIGFRLWERLIKENSSYQPLLMQIRHEGLM